ncbi:MAG: NAD-dependent epimerase/dehydratase family protein [Paracoccaceae bacterium]
MPSALITGSAGFIGFHLCQRLLQDGWTVTGFDAVTDYYDVKLKHRRLEMLAEYPQFTQVTQRLESPGCLSKVFADTKPDLVVHLAAQAGVRYSIDHPETYVNSNLIGTFRLLEAARHTPVKHLMLASTSSVYGANTDMPYGETDKADSQMSFYAATKKANEAMAHSYAHLYNIPTTMFRFFTVYGPWGRPDMAHFKFTKAILNGDPIDIYNHGKMRRDFTYIDDLVEAIHRLSDVAPTAPGSNRTAIAHDNLSSVAPFRVVNIGNSQPTGLMEYVSAIEQAIGQTAQKNFHPMQPGDVPETYADTALLRELTGFTPSTSVADGIAKFVKWYREYYAVVSR